MRPIRVLPLAVALWVGCTDSTGPSIAGPPFVKAVIDGVTWTNNAAGQAFGQINPESTLVVVGIASAPGILQSLGFQVGRFHSTGTYALSFTRDPGPINSGYYTIQAGPSLSDVQHYATDSANTGQVRVTSIDTAARIVTGTFMFTAVQPGGPAIVHVMEGSFRVHYP